MKQLVEERISPRPGPRLPAGIRTTTAPVLTAHRKVEDGPRLRHQQHVHIFREGDPADRAYQIIDGAVMLYKLLPDGRRQIVELLGPGDVFGLSATPVYDCSAETLVAGSVAIHERAALESSPQLVNAISQRMRSQIAALHEHTVLLGRKSALERVATFLMRWIPDRGGYGCKGAANGKDRAVIRLRMTRQEIADYLGLTIETVSRAFSELRRRGIVSIEKIDEVQVNDVCGMCRMTGAH